MTPEQLKLVTPAPWIYSFPGCVHVVCLHYKEPSLAHKEAEANAEFIALARNAEDVMLQRKWNPTRRPDGQWVVEDDHGNIHSKGSEGWHHPFVALCEADAWVKKHVEKEVKP